MPCGGRRKALAAVTDAAAAERILCHVGLWRADGDDEVENVAVRGPLGEELWPVDAAPSAELDGWDAPAPVDEAASRQSVGQQRPGVVRGGQRPALGGTGAFAGWKSGA